MRTGAAARCVLLALSVALAGCGGTAHKSTTAHRSTPPPRQNQVVSTSTAPELISMRRIDGATWQTVVIHTDGTGDVGIFIGEWTGFKHKRFRLSSGELARLDRLVTVARRTPEKAYFGLPAPSTVYIIYVQRHILQVGKGHEPRELTPLTGMLGGLIDQYA